MPVALAGRWLGWSRPWAAAGAAAACWALGLASVLSFNAWSGWYPLAWVPGLATATAFDCLDRLTSNGVLPLGGLGLAIFGGWVMPRRVLVEELRLGRVGGLVILVALRYVVPVGIVAASLASLAR
jgi:NSS family neurotransmitter:Na+ symporter